MIRCRGEYWFPLALLGLLSMLTGWGGTTPVPAEASFGWFAYGPVTGPHEPDVQYFASLYARDDVAVSPPGSGAPGMQFLSQENYAELMAERAWQSGLGGFAVVVTAYLCTMLWYAVRTRMRGHTVAAGRLTLFTVCGAIEMGLVHWLAWEAHSALDLGPEFVLVFVLMFGAFLTCAAIGAMTAGGRNHRAMVVTAVVLAWASLCLVPVVMMPEAVTLMILVTGLLALAWWERSVLLAAVTAGFLLAVLFGGSVGMDGLPAAVLLAGAIAALVLRVQHLERRWTMEL